MIRISSWNNSIHATRFGNHFCPDLAKFFRSNFPFSGRGQQIFIYILLVFYRVHNKTAQLSVLIHLRFPDFREQTGRDTPIQRVAPNSQQTISSPQARRLTNHCSSLCSLEKYILFFIFYFFCPQIISKPAHHFQEALPYKLLHLVKFV